MTSVALYGGVADNATDIGAPLQAAYNAGVGCIYIPAGVYLMTTPVVINAQPPCFVGAGWNENVNGTLSSAKGTWIHISSTSLLPFSITGVTGQGATPGFRRIAFYEDQPTPGGGYAPNAYQYIFTASNNLGRVDFDNLMFFNATHCISLTNSARSRVVDISGQPQGTCITADKQHDISFLDRIQFWPFWSSDANVGSYQQTNVNPIVYQRVDGPFIGSVFIFGYKSGFAFQQSSDGVSSGVQISNLSTDAVKYGLWNISGNPQIQIGNLRTAGEGFVSGIFAGSEGYRDDGAAIVDVANFQCFAAGSNCVHVAGAGRININNAQLWNFNNDNNSSSGLNAETTGYISTANSPEIVNPQHGGTTIPAGCPNSGTYALHGVRQCWTPVMVGTSSNPTVNYTTQTGDFFYDGSSVTMTFKVSVSSYSGGSGNWAIQGLPFVYNMPSTHNTYCTISTQSGVTLDVNYSILSAIATGGGANQFLMLESGSGQPSVAVPLADFGAGGFVFGGTCTMMSGQ